MMTRKLNTDQLAILNLLYQFRFGTTTLFTNYLKPNNRQSLNSRLNILAKQQYIGKIYEKGFKLLGKPAVYYLLPKAFAELKRQPNISAKAIKNMYKDKQASQRFIDHCLAIFTIHNKLNDSYGNRLEFFAKNELVEYEHFPQPLPDAFIKLKTSDKLRAHSRLFFLEVLEDDAPFFVNVRRLKKYFEYVDEGDWDVTGEKMPRLLVICNSATLQKRLVKRVLQGFDSESGVKVFITTNDEFLQNGPWLPIIYPSDGLVYLDDLL